MDYFYLVGVPNSIHNSQFAIHNSGELYIFVTNTLKTFGRALTVRVRPKRNNTYLYLYFSCATTSEFARSTAIWILEQIFSSPISYPRPHYGA